MDQIIYAYWNGQQLYNILNAVVLVTSGANAGTFSQLMASIALIAFLVSVGVGLAKLRATDTAVAFMSLTFFYGVFFLPTVTVTIDDIRLNQQYQVANVPLGLALFGGATSNIGHWLTDAYETYFTSVDDEKFSKYGFLFGTRLVNELPKQYYKNPSVRENARNFIINCVNPELDANPQLVNALTMSTDIWSFIAGQSTPALSLNPGRVTPYYNQWANTQSVLPCIGPGGVYDTAGASGMFNVDTLVGTFNEMNLLGKKLQPGVENNDWAWSEISDFETSMLGISRNAMETVRHYALINMMRDANADRADVLGATVAANQLEHSYNIMAILAEGALPKIRNLIEATIYAVFPIVFLIVIGAGASGGKVLTTYAMTAVWVQLWAPLYAVINSFMFHTSSTDLLTLTNSAGGTIQTIPHMLQMCASDQAIAGLMTLSVPAIALAIVKGGTVALSGVANSLMSPAAGAANRVGADIGSGKTTLGGAGIHGTSFDSSVSYTQPQTKINTPSGSLAYDTAGQLTGFNPNPMGTGGASVTTERQDGARVTDASGSGTRTGQRVEAGFQTGSDAKFTRQNSAEFGRRLETAVANRVGAEFRSNVTDGAGRHVGGDSRRGSGTSLSTDEAAKIRSYLGLGANVRDESSVGKDGRSSQSYNEPGGGGQGTTGGRGTGGQGTSVARAGTVGPDTKHENILSRGRRAAGLSAVTADVGGGVETSQRLQDIAKNENGQFTRNEQQWAAQTLASAVNDVTTNTTDQGIRAAAQRYMADNGFSARATSGESAHAENYNEAGQRVERFGNGATGGSMRSEAPVVQAARALVRAEGLSGVQADMEALHRLQTDEGFRAQAVAAAMKNEGHSGDPVSGKLDMPDPRTPESVNSEGAKMVAAMETKGKEVVNQTGARANGVVTAHQPASPNSAPDTTRPIGEYNRVQAASKDRQAQLAQQAAFSAGSNNLAAQLYQNKEHGMSKVASIAYLGGLGYDSPSGYSAALEIASQKDPGLRAEIAQYSSGQKASDEDLERIFNKVSGRLK